VGEKANIGLNCRRSKEVVVQAEGEEGQAEKREKGGFVVFVDSVRAGDAQRSERNDREE
jgi:hypothetical protein